jgi:Flp pilus assembly protein CpaB
MNMRSLIIGIGALFIAVIAAVVARNMFASSAVQQVQAAPVKQEAKFKVLVAAKT